MIITELQEEKTDSKQLTVNSLNAFDSHKISKNYKITSFAIEGGAKEKFKRNILAIKTLKEKYSPKNYWKMMMVLKF